MIYITQFFSFLKIIGNKTIPIKDLVLLLGVILLILFGIHKINKPISNTEKPKLEQVQNHLGKDGKVVSAIEEHFYTQKDINNLTDSIKKIWKVKGKTQSFLQYVGSVDTILKPVPFYINDTAHSIFAKDSSRYYEVTFTGNSKTKYGNFYLHLTNDTLSALTIKKNYLFKSSVYTTFLKHSNQLVNTTVGESYTIKVPKERFVIGPSLGVQYIPSTGKFMPFIGLGITYNLIAIKSKK